MTGTSPSSHTLVCKKIYLCIFIFIFIFILSGKFPLRFRISFTKEYNSKVVNLLLYVIFIVIHFSQLWSCVRFFLVLSQESLVGKNLRMNWLDFDHWSRSLRPHKTNFLPWNSSSPLDSVSLLCLIPTCSSRFQITVWGIQCDPWPSGGVCAGSEERPLVGDFSRRSTGSSVQWWDLPSSLG